MSLGIATVRVTKPLTREQEINRRLWAFKRKALRYNAAVYDLSQDCNRAAAAMERFAKLLPEDAEE